MSLEADSSQEPPDKSPPGRHIDFGLVRPEEPEEPTCTSGLQNSEIIDGYCFMPLCVWCTHYRAIEHEYSRAFYPGEKHEHDNTEYSETLGDSKELGNLRRISRKGVAWKV